MELVKVFKSFVEEKKRENDLKLEYFRMCNIYGYIGGSLFSAIVSETNNPEVQYQDVACEELLRLTTPRTFVYRIPEFIQLNSSNEMAIKRRMRNELVRIFNIQSNEEYKSKYLVELLNRQVIVRFLS